MPAIIENQAQAIDTHHIDGVMFRCSECSEVKPVETSGGTGYAWPAGPDNPEAKPICYACCGKRDVADMIATGRATLYLTQPERFGPGLRLESYGRTGHAVVTNWPGTLKLTAFVRQGRHNIAGKRYDAWFTGPDGAKWHGVTYGDNTQICHCHRTKTKAA